MTSIGSVSHGDANTILEEVEEYYFDPDFKEYMLKEQLKWSRHVVDFLGRSYYGSVFWSEQNHEIEPSLSLDNWADFNRCVRTIPKVRDNIRHALQKLILMRPVPSGWLVQFWAATTTLEGRTKLTTQYQPFALGGTYYGYERSLLCSYRMKMCSKYKFYADTQSGEEQLGIPGRVFLDKSPEYAHNVKYYSEKEYPQLNLALSCKIGSSWGVPVFEHSSHTCVGVLEMVSLCCFDHPPVWHDESYLSHMYDSFQLHFFLQTLGDGPSGHTILDKVEDYFPPNFKEALKWWRLHFAGSYFGCVFWSQQDREIEPSLSLDNCADFNPNVFAIPKVRDNIRHALQKLILLSSKFTACLVQFWAATTTLDGRTLLTTKYQPFALGPTSKNERQQLCEYRVKMCREYNFFYADAQSGEEQLGLPGRVFLHQFPESALSVEYYTTKEYPQRDLALRCKIRGSLVVPVFEHSSRTCVGVLEKVCLSALDDYDGHTGYFFDNMHHILQEFGLQYFDGYQACEDEYWEKQKRVKGLTHAFQELKTVLRSVSQSHELPLAMTWVPCSACNGLRRCKLRSSGVEFCKRKHFYGKFLKASKCRHLRKGLVAGRALSSPNMLYCSDITQLSLDEYPLVPYARQCKLSGWFTICLQNVHTGNDIYLLEFFLSAKSNDDENILTTLSFILGTMENNFKNFRLASGKELGELMSIEVIHFQNNQKIHFVQSIQATREFSMSSISSSVQSSASVAYVGPGFHSDPFSDSDSDSVEQSSASVRFQMVTIKAEYASVESVLKLSLPCRLVELQQEVAKRLMLEAGTYHVGYKDEEDEFVLIACDEDLQDYIDDSISQGNTSPVVMLVPATNLNRTN